MSNHFEVTIVLCPVTKQGVNRQLMEKSQPPPLTDESIRAQLLPAQGYAHTQPRMIFRRALTQ